jgi:hypothetical protein
VQASDSHDQSNANQAQDEQEASPTLLHPSNDQASTSNQPMAQPSNLARAHPLEHIIGDISRGVQTRSRLATFCQHYSFVSLEEEPKTIQQAFKNEDWINAMHEELNNFERNKVWELVKRPKNKNVIDTKWVFKNK